MGNTSLWYENVQFAVCDPSYKDQSAILPTSISRNSPTTKTFRGSASLASPTHIKNNQQIRHLTFRPSFNHLMMAVLPRSLFYARHRDPFFARMPSLSLSASPGVPWSAPFPILLPLPRQLHHHHQPSPSRTTKVKSLRRPHPPHLAAASSLHQCEVASALSHVRARSGVRALLRDVVPYPTARRCGS
jgi:hypothetical protein